MLLLLKKPARLWILLFFGLLWNVFLILSFSKFGIGLSADSANYVSAANNLWNGFGLIQFDGYKYLNAPPLYVWLLLPAFLFGMSPTIWALVLNLICQNLSFFLVARLANKVLGAPNAVIGVVFCMTGYWAFTHAFQMLLSESVFIAILLIFISTLEQEIQDFKPLIWSSLWLGALCATRYAGLMMIPGIIVLLYLSKIPLQRIVLFLIPTLLFTLCWSVRNYLISGQFFGGHLLKNKVNFVGIISNISNLDIRLKLAFFILLLLFIVGFMIKHNWSFVFKICLFMGSSYWFLLLLQGGINMNQMPRYLSIVEFLVGLLLLELIAFLISNVNKQNIFWGALLGFKLLFLFSKVETNMQQGAGGFHTNTWQKIAMLEKLKSVEGSNLLSNYPDHLFWMGNNFSSYSRFKEESEPSFISRTPKEGKMIWFHINGRESVIADIRQPSRDYTLRLSDSCEWFSIYTYSANVTLDHSTYYK